MNYFIFIGYLKTGRGEGRVSSEPYEPPSGEPSEPPLDPPLKISSLKIYNVHPLHRIANKFVN